MTRPNRQIEPERGDDGGVYGHIPGLAELRVPNRKDRSGEIDIAAV